MYIVNICDHNHSHNSMKVIGIAEDINTAVNLCALYASRNEGILTQGQYEMLRDTCQTQGDKHNGYEFYLNEVEINQLCV
jgi:hypothetical protein